MLLTSLLVALIWASVNAAGFYSGNGAVTELTPKTFRTKVAQSNTTSIVEFYAPWCGHCQNLKPEYIKAAKKALNLVPFYAVNCDDDVNKPLCAKYKVEGFPSIKSFRPGSKKNVPRVDDYRGQRTAKAMSDFAFASIPNKVKIVTTKNGDAFLQEKTNRVVLTAKKGQVGVPPLFKVIANEYNSQAKFGFVPFGQELATKLVNDSDDSKSHLVFIPSSGEIKNYEGAMKRDAIIEFIKQQLSQATDSAAPSASSSKQSSETSAATAAEASSESSTTEETTTEATAAAPPKPKRGIVEEKVRKVIPHDGELHGEEDIETRDDSSDDAKTDSGPEPATPTESVENVDIEDDEDEDQAADTTEAEAEVANDPSEDIVEEQGEESEEEPAKENIQEDVKKAEDEAEAVQEEEEEEAQEDVEEEKEEQTQEDVNEDEDEDEDEEQDVAHSPENSDDVDDNEVKEEVEKEWVDEAIKEAEQEVEDEAIKEAEQELAEEATEEVEQELAEEASGEAHKDDKKETSTNDNKIQWARIKSLEELHKECIDETKTTCILLATSAYRQLSDIKLINHVRSELSSDIRQNFKFAYLLDIDKEMKSITKDLKLSNSYSDLNNEEWSKHPGTLCAIHDNKIANMQDKFNAENVQKFIADVYDDKIGLEELPLKFKPVHDEL